MRLQLRELLAGVEDERRQVVRDYVQADASWDLEQAIDTLSDLTIDELLDAEEVVHSLHLSGQTDDLDAPIEPRGFRMLSKIPRLPAPVAQGLVDHFSTLNPITRSTVDELAAVDGVGEHWAETIKVALSRIAETSILERYRT